MIQTPVKCTGESGRCQNEGTYFIYIKDKAYPICKSCLKWLTNFYQITLKW